MLYVIVDKVIKGRVLLVKAENEQDFEKRINLEPNEEVAGNFTTAEVNALQSAAFVVISSYSQVG